MAGSEHLRRGPLRRADALLRVGERGRVLEHLRHAEVAHLGDAVGVDEHVGRLEVEVEHWRLEAVQVVHAERHLAKHANHVLGARQRLWVLVEQVVQRPRAELEEDAERGGLEACAEEAHLDACARPSSEAGCMHERHVVSDRLYVCAPRARINACMQCRLS